MYLVVTVNKPRRKEIQAMAHSNKILAQLLKLIDGHEFQTLVNGHFQSQRKYGDK